MTNNESDQPAAPFATEAGRRLKARVRTWLDEWAEGRLALAEVAAKARAEFPQPH